MPKSKRDNTMVARITLTAVDSRLDHEGQVTLCVSSL
jgi:hypothetical protein